MKKDKNKKIKINPARHESFEETLERYGQDRLFSLGNLMMQVKKNKRAQ